MSQNHFLIAAFLFGSLSLAGCDGDSSKTDAPGTDKRTVGASGFRLTLVQPGLAPAFQRLDAPAGASISVTEATVNVSEVAFKAPEGYCGNGGGNDENKDADKDLEKESYTVSHNGDVAHVVVCEHDDFTVVHGPIRFNLLTGESSPSLEAITIPTATYRWIDLRLAPVTDSSDPMNGVSVIANGEYHAGSTIPVHIAMLITDPPIRIAPQGGIPVTTSSNITVAISAVDWFANVENDVNACAGANNAPYVDGVLQLTGESGTACDSINGTLRQNFIGASSKAEVKVERR